MTINQEIVEAILKKRSDKFIKKVQSVIEISPNYILNGEIWLRSSSISKIFGVYQRWAWTKSNWHGGEFCIKYHEVALNSTWDQKVKSRDIQVFNLLDVLAYLDERYAKTGKRPEILDDV